MHKTKRTEAKCNEIFLYRQKKQGGNQIRSLYSEENRAEVQVGMRDTMCDVTEAPSSKN